MKALVAVLLALCLTFNSYAQPVPRNTPLTAMVASTPDGNLKVWLYRDACEEPKVMAHIPPHLQKRFSRARVLHNKTQYEACYASYQDGAAYWLVDETGDQGSLPSSLFKLEQGV